MAAINGRAWRRVRRGADAVGVAVAKTRMDKRRALAFPVNGFFASDVRRVRAIPKEFGTSIRNAGEVQYSFILVS